LIVRTLYRQYYNTGSHTAKTWPAYGSANVVTKLQKLNVNILPKYITPDPNYFDFKNYQAESDI
jgi:hypothetical protein